MSVNGVLWYNYIYNHENRRNITEIEVIDP